MYPNKVMNVYVIFVFLTIRQSSFSFASILHKLDNIWIVLINKLNEEKKTTLAVTKSTDRSIKPFEIFICIFMMWENEIIQIMYFLTHYVKNSQEIH